MNDISIEEYSCLESVVYVCSYHVYNIVRNQEHFMVCRALKLTLSETMFLTVLLGFQLWPSTGQGVAVQPLQESIAFSYVSS